jgi:DNA-binding NarL/FixJ family response regulator
MTMKYRVLIVDDQKVVSRLLRSALETIEEGLIVSEAPSGEEAILEVGRTKIDLLVVDYRLPGITGVELVRKIRAIRPGCKAIMVSGVTDPAQLKQINDIGVEAFFQKPVPIGDFLGAVESCLGLTRTVLPPSAEHKPAEAIQTERPGLSGLLIDLRKNLNAQAALLLNDRGHVVAEAGQLPGPDEKEPLFSALSGMVSSAQKAAILLAHAENHLHLFSGTELDAIYLPVGLAHSLLLVGKALADGRALPSRLDSLEKTRAQLLDELKNLGVPLESSPVEQKQTSRVEEPVTQPEELPGDFLNFLNQIGKKPSDVDSFWESAVEKGTSFSEPDKLSYDEASRLGLTPDSAQEK